MARARVCDLAGCDVSLVGMHPSRRFCTDTHRKAAKRKPSVAHPPRPVSTAVLDALSKELEELEVADTYEGRIALGIAEQLDRGTVVGTAYASLSKELDRRVDALRLKADRPDEPVRVVTDSFESKRAHLRSA